jgi:GNAT superfamily N-acetyltransferase
MKFLFRLATGKDDPELRRLMAATPVPGSLTVAFEREPDFFAACPTMGDCLTLLAIEADSQRLAASVCLARQERWWTKQPQTIGYVGGLRVHPDFRGTGILGRAMPFIRRTAAEWGDIPWFTVIPAGNRSSEGLFVRNIRASFPGLEPLTELVTLGLATGRHRKISSLTGFDGDTATTAGSPLSGTTRSNLLPGRNSIQLHLASPTEVSGFLAEHPRELRPCWKAEDLGPGSSLGQFRLIGASRDGVLVGTAAIWDQKAFKQSVVRAYSPGLASIRPLYNLAGRLAGFPVLPDPGKAIRSAYLSCLCVPGTEAKDGGDEGNSNDVMQVARLLLKEAVRLAGSMGKDYLMAGFSARDPLLTLARIQRHVSYHSSLYTFSFAGQESPAIHDAVSNPCVEIGTL